MMNRRFGRRVDTLPDAVNPPGHTPRSPQFVSTRRLPSPPPPEPPRRTVYEIFEDVCYYISIVCIVVFILELLVQVVMYGYFQSPGGRSATTGQKLIHYEILGVSPAADQDAITTGWRLQSNAFHPDTVEAGNTEEARERYYWIQLAYVELSDPLARCYHDQFHGYLPRKWGGDDPCTKILTKTERELRKSTELTPEAVRNEMLRRLEKGYGVSLNWLKATKKKRDGREWKNSGWWETLWGGLGDYGKYLVAWHYVVVGGVLAMIEYHWRYFVKYFEWEKRHFQVVRERFNQLVEELVEIWARTAG